MSENIDEFNTTCTALAPFPDNLVGKENPSKKAKVNKNGLKGKQVEIKEEKGSMKKIVEVLLEEGILEEDIHRILSLIEEEYEIVYENIYDDHKDAEEAVKHAKANPSIENKYNATRKVLHVGDEAIKSGIPVEGAENRDKIANRLGHLGNLKSVAGALDKTLATKTGKPAPKKDGINTTLVDKANASVKRKEADAPYKKLWGNKIK